jgi:hypothetical protein
MGLATQAQNIPIERAIKATYLYKLAPFVEWPPGAFDGGSEPFRLCVVGNDPFGEVLDRAVAGQAVAERPIVVTRLDRAERDAHCQIMFVAGSDAQSSAAALAAVRGRPILTVTDGAREERSSGMVNFVIRDNRVRFEIDERAAAANGIVISSKLLSLAISVKRRA